MENHYYVLRRIGVVYSTFHGTEAELEAHVARLNETDEQGSTEIESTHPSAKECLREFYRLNE